MRRHNTLQWSKSNGEHKFVTVKIRCERHTHLFKVSSNLEIQIGRQTEESHVKIYTNCNFVSVFLL